MMRFPRRLSDADLALDRSMIPLGSCTMKLNAAAEMEAITWPGFADLHPFAPADESQGYRRLIDDLEAWLVAVTGYDAVSVQPNAGSQGSSPACWRSEPSTTRAGVAARSLPDPGECARHERRQRGYGRADGGGRRLRRPGQRGPRRPTGQDRRRPGSAGRADDHLPVHPRRVRSRGGQVCELVHAAGGQVYLDGANLNALVGLAAPGEFGADVSHLNLHKTFCIPHGGGGPGVGPVAVRATWPRTCPDTRCARRRTGGSWLRRRRRRARQRAPWGSAGVLPISYAYIRMMGRRV